MSVVRDEAARDAAARLIGELQERICARALAAERDVATRTGAPAAEFRIDAWSRDGALSGHGSTRVIADGVVFEKGGVNTSVVTGGALPPSVVAQRPELAGHGFFAAGVSVVLHPRNPHAPTAHCNYRYFEARSPEGARSAWWFGGGADLTPYYPVLDDVRHFHAALRAACDRHDPGWYPAFKAWCDRYFFLKHRGETRGVGGIFYDYLDADGFGESHERTPLARPRSFEEILAFMRDAGEAFGEAYFPIVERRAEAPFGERERAFQLLRRGRYVEFNLVYDRGTHFGLQSGGRTESILMSLPPLVRWSYDERPEPGSPEAELLAYLRPRDWFAGDPLRA
ncbi:MAG: oxygen-dependent coproporphyrinogen oxidase [Candidatus Eremiobacteraeota bacterium]|nr:oxygen-dependent coproporphyrinogen oxidase [Candidatus Eremiobacteraeota bacterium]